VFISPETSGLLMGLGILGLISSTVFNGLTFAGVSRFVTARRRSRKTDQDFCPPVSLLKPLHGAEPDLEAHISSFFEQDYPNYEILFCARNANDAGLKIARRVAARYPWIATKFLTTGENTYVNAKASSMERMASAASNDIFVISDSDVRVTPDYIREVVAPFVNEKVGAVTCLYRGVAKEGFWAKLEAAGMSIEMTSGVVVANMMEGMKFMLGPTMAVRRSCVQEIGGFAFLGPYCADDFVLGSQIAANGHEVVLSDHVIDHVVLNRSFSDSIKHQIRWMKSTRFSRPKGHFGTSLTFALPFGLLACIGAWGLGKHELALAMLAYSVVARMIMAAVVGGRVVQERHLLRTTLLYPIRDLLGFFYWLASYSSSKVLWRGQVFRLVEGGLMQSVADSGTKQPEPAHEPAMTA
jgi:ceramide glucosyltransferase